MVTAHGVVLGRAPSCDIPIPDRGVSREHARVLLHNSAVWVQDAGSRNGVFVNGKRVVRHKQLGLGAELVIGDHAFTLELLRADETPSPQQSPPQTLPVLSPAESGDLTIDLPAPDGLGADLPTQDLGPSDRVGDAGALTEPGVEAPQETVEGKPPVALILGGLAVLAVVIVGLVLAL